MNSLLPNKQNGLLFIISAPAGTGKTTLVNLLLQEFPDLMVNVSYTTRAPRKSEISGQHYHFVSEEEFKAKIKADEFLEYVLLYGTYYGTSRKWINAQQQQGKHVLLVIDTQGALQIKSVCSSILIFIRPPSLDILKERLEGRQTETDNEINTRLNWAAKEMAAINHYDYDIINDDLMTAYQVLRSIVIAECHRIDYLHNR